MTNEEIYNGLINQCKECKANHTDDCDDCKIPLVMVAIEKRIPKKLEADRRVFMQYVCPVCKGIQEGEVNYCWHCGQRLDGKKYE